MGSESLTDTDDALASQVAVNTDNISRLFGEQEKLRDRLHSVEADRATVLLLAQKVDNLARDLPTMVERAAETAAEKVAEADTPASRTPSLCRRRSWSTCTPHSLYRAYRRGFAEGRRHREQRLVSDQPNESGERDK